MTQPHVDLSAELLDAFCRSSCNQLLAGEARIQHCVDQLTHNQLWWRPAESMNSIANLLLHLSGNLRQWLIAGIPTVPDVRQRQREFDDRSLIGKSELLGRLETTIQEACQTIRGQSASELLRVRKVQQFDLNGIETIQDSIGHFQGHVQEIVHMTRCQLSDNYRYHFLPDPDQN